MITLIGGLRLVDGMVVVDQVGVPLVGLGPQEAIEAFEATSGRPVAASGGQVHLFGRAQVPLAHHVGVPTPLGQDLGQGAVLGRDDAAGVGEPDGAFGNTGHGVAGVVAPSQQARTSRGAQCGRVPLGVAQPFTGDSVDVRRLDRAAVTAHGREIRHRPRRCRPRWAPRVPGAPQKAPSRVPSLGCRRLPHLGTCPTPHLLLARDRFVPGQHVADPGSDAPPT